MIKIRYKKTFILSILLFIQLSCSTPQLKSNIPNFIINNKSYSVVNDSPIEIIINEQGNGTLISYDYKSITIKPINNLSLSNNEDTFRPYLGTTSNLYTLAALIDENGNGIVIYDIGYIESENTFRLFANTKDKVIYGFHAIDVKNGMFVKDSAREIEGSFGSTNAKDSGKNHELIKTKSGKYIFWHLSKASVGAEFLSMTEISRKESVNYPNISRLQSESNLNISIDDEGNGYFWYIYDEYNKERSIRTYLKSYKSENTSTIDLNNESKYIKLKYLINIYFDNKGDGYALVREDIGIVLYQVSNFENLSNMNILINQNDDHLKNSEIKLDKSGNGYLIFNDSYTLDATFKKIINYKSVKDFKLTDYKFKELPYIQSYFPMFTVSLNSKGDGLVILKNLQDDVSYFVRKIKNYEPI